MTPGPAPTLVYLVRSFPRLSQTFVLDEMLRLERMGAHLELFTLAASGERLVHSDVARLRAAPRLLEPASAGDHLLVGLAAPRRYVTALVTAARQAGHEKGYHAGSRLDAFARSVALARHLNRLRRRRPVHLHAHFAHDPALTAHLAHLLTGVDYSFTAHARDVHQVSPALLGERATAAKAVVACCATNAAVLEAVAPGNVLHVPHGVDTDFFRPGPGRRDRAERVPLIVAVGRLVEKKGFDDLLEALSLLRSRGVPFRAEVYGDGPLRDHLLALVDRLELAPFVSFPGARTREELLPAYQRADIFALTPYPTGGGDVDGIPNVIMEAMACGLPVVATAAGGVAEAISPGHDGLLARPRDIDAVAGHLATLLSGAELRERMGRAARRTAVERFDGWSAARRLLELFGASARGRILAGAAGDDHGHVPVDAVEDPLGAGAGPCGRSS